MRLSAEMYDQIVAGLKSDSQQHRDKRREPRVGMSGDVEFVTVDEGGKRVAGLVKIRDVSRGGVGLVFTRELAANQRFVIQLASSTGEPIWLVCITAYCRRLELGRFSVGGRITQLLRAEQIQQVEAKTAAATAVAKQTVVAPVPIRAAVPQPDQDDIARISRAILG